MPSGQLEIALILAIMVVTIYTHMQELAWTKVHTNSCKEHQRIRGKL